MEIFGLSITKKKVKESEKTESFAPTDQQDGAVIIGDGINNSFAHNFDVAFDSDKELIDTYREMAGDPDVDWAIDDIVNESLNFDPDKKTVEINLEKTKFSASVKNSIYEEFEYIQRLLNFYKKGDEIYRRWYIDGRIYFHKIVNKNKLSEGIKEIRYIEPTNIKKVIEEDRVVKEDGIEVFRKGKQYFTYTNRTVSPNRALNNQSALKIIKVPSEAITYIHSGIFDPKTNLILSYLHKAIKPHNLVRMLEDATAIYKIARAPSRRVFYVDVGQLSKTNAEQYMRGLMNNYKNKSVYDASTGKIKNDTHHISMLEDIWLPRSEGKTTEVTTLDAVNGFSDMDEVLYFRSKLFKSLHLPASRLEDGAVFGMGRSSEINRDEVKFAKFITKLRKKFSYLFMDILYTQLILKKIITEQDWAEIKNDVTFDYNQDSHFAELKESEILTGRLEQLEAMNDYVGRYWSKEWIRKNVLKQSDEEIKNIDKQIDQELKDGEINDYVEAEAMQNGMGEEPSEEGEEPEPEEKPEKDVKPKKQDDKESEPDEEDKEKE